MWSRFFCCITQKANETKQAVTTVILVTQYNKLKLSDENQTRESIHTEITKALEKATPSAPKEVYSSHQAYLDSFTSLSSIGFPRFNCFTYLSVPSEDVETGTSLITGKKSTWLSDNFSLSDDQIQFSVILDDQLAIEKPLAPCIAGETYQPLAVLLAGSVLDLEKIAKEITNLFKNSQHTQSPIYNALAAKKSLTDLTDVFNVVSSEKAQSQQEDFIKEAVLNLLAIPISHNLSLTTRGAIFIHSPALSNIAVAIQAITEYLQPLEITRRRTI